MRQLLADTTGVSVAAPVSNEPVLLGSAMLGAVAGNCFPDLGIAMSSMSKMGKVFEPVTGNLTDWHTQRYGGFELLQEVGRKLR